MPAERNPSSEASRALHADSMQTARESCARVLAIPKAPEWLTVNCDSIANEHADRARLTDYDHIASGFSGQIRQSIQRPVRAPVQEEKKKAGDLDKHTKPRARGYFA